MTKNYFLKAIQTLLVFSLAFTLTSCWNFDNPLEDIGSSGGSGGNGGSTEPTMLETPLTFEAKSAGAKVTFIANDDAIEKTVEFSTDDGATWTEKSTNNTAGGIVVTLTNVGDKVMFRGTNAAYSDLDKYNSFSCTADCYVYGNVMSLINKDNFATNTTLEAQGTFYYLFKDNTKIYNHDSKTLELPATTLQDACYKYMFLCCTNLTKAPNLPATDLANHCYYSMFESCYALTSTQEELPATTLQTYCYMGMFHGCSALTKAPKLPAPSLVGYCYQSMFDGCTNLNEAWVKADYVDDTPCNYMFSNCTTAGTLHTDGTNWTGHCGSLTPSNPY